MELLCDWLREEDMVEIKLEVETRRFKSCAYEASQGRVCSVESRTVTWTEEFMIF